MAERRGQAAAASTQADPVTTLPLHNTNDVTVEYIKENDFGPHRVKKYSPRSLGRPKRATGKGYYVTHESESFVRKVVEKAAAATQKKDPARTQSSRTRRSVGGNAGPNEGPETPNNAKSDPVKEQQIEVSTLPVQNVPKESSTPSKVEPAEYVVVPATSSTPKSDAPKATNLSEPRANKTRSIQLPVAVREVPNKPNVTPKPSNLVADTISSLVNLFGERRKQQGGGSVGRPVAGRTPTAESAVKVETTTPTTKRRVGRTPVASATPTTKTDSQTNTLVKRTTAIATTEVQVKSTVSPAVPALPAASSTPVSAPVSTGGRMARRRVGATPDTNTPVGSTTRSTPSTPAPGTLPEGGVRRTDTTASTDHDTAQQTAAVSAAGGLATALGNVVHKAIGATNTSTAKKTVTKVRAAATAASQVDVEKSTEEEAVRAIEVAPPAPTATAATRRGRAAAKSSNTLTLTPPKSGDNVADQDLTIAAKADLDEQSDLVKSTAGNKAPKTGDWNIPAMAMSPAKIVTTNSEGIVTVSLEKSAVNSPDNVAEKITSISTEYQIGSAITPAPATRKGRGRPARTKTAVAATAVTAAISVGESVPEVTAETSGIPAGETPADPAPSTAARRRRGNPGKRKASPEKEAAPEGKPSARSVNLAKRVAAKAGRGNARKRARLTSNTAEDSPPGVQEIQPAVLDEPGPLAVLDDPPEEAVLPAAAGPTDTNSRVSQALTMVQMVSQQVGKPVPSDATPSISSHLKEKIISKVSRESAASQLQQSPEEELDEASEEVTGKGTIAQSKRRMRKPVDIVKTFPLRSRQVIESDPEEAEDEEVKSVVEQVTPVQQKAISVQKRPLVQSDNNPVAETAPSSEELQEIDVSVKKKRGRPARRKSETGSGLAVQSATTKQPTGGVGRKRRGRSAKEAAPQLPPDMTEDEEAMSVVSVDGSISVVSVDESIGMASVESAAMGTNMQTLQEKISGAGDVGSGPEQKGRTTRSRKPQQTVTAAIGKQPLHSTPKLSVVRKLRGRSAKRAALEVPSDVTEDDGSISLASVESGDISTNLETSPQKTSVTEVDSDEETLADSQLEGSVGGPDLVEVDSDEDFTSPDGGPHGAGMKQTGLQPEGEVLQRRASRQVKESGLKQDERLPENPTVIGVTPPPAQRRSRTTRQNRSRLAPDTSADFSTTDSNLENPDETNVSVLDDESELSHDVSLADVDERSESIISTEDFLDALSVHSDQSSLSSFSFRTPLGHKGTPLGHKGLPLGHKGPSRKRKQRPSEDRELGPASKSTRVDETPLSVSMGLVETPPSILMGPVETPPSISMGPSETPPSISTPPSKPTPVEGTPVISKAVQKRHKSQLAFEQKLGVARVGDKVVCPDCGLHVGPFYLQRHMKSDRCTSASKSNTAPAAANLSVETDTSLVSAEGTVKQPVVTPIQTATPDRLVTPLQTMTPVQTVTPKLLVMPQPLVTPEQPVTPIPIVTSKTLVTPKRLVTPIQREGAKVVCPDCGQLVGPYYLQRHRKTDRCNPANNPNLSAGEGTPQQSVTPKQTQKPKQPQSGTPGQVGTPPQTGKACSKCGRVLKSNLAQHERWCGLENVKEACAVCEEQVLVKKMDTHRAYCRRLPPPEETEDPELQADGSQRRKGRHAAKRAMSNIHDLIKSMSSHKPVVPKKPRYTNPKEVTKYLKKKWERDLAADGEIRCPMSISASHCGFVSKSVAGVADHYVRCPYHNKTYKCVQCKHEAPTPRQAKQHARMHTWSDGDSDGELSDVSVYDDEDADPDAYPGADPDSDNSGSERNTSLRRRPPVRTAPIRTKRLDVSKKMHFAERLEMFQDALDWTLDWKQRNQPGELGVMADWAPSAGRWRHLTDSEASQYLPTSGCSPWFSYHKPGSDRMQTNLTRFESITEPLTLLNVGGPVWALDWLPTPIGLSCTQYLAVYCHRQHDKHHSINKATSGMAAIQIWACHTMHVKKLETAPKLSLILAQNDGAIWCLKWSPRRVWPREEETQEGRLPWLGTLAVATSNGKVNIYSIPVPESLPQAEGGSDLPVYKVTPVLTLELQSLDNKTAMLQNCRCLDWQYLGGCHRLLAGYAGGQVALYDLLTSSRLLLTPGGGDRPHVLRPLVSFMAHGCPVTSLAFCQRRPTFFTTVSQDRQMKVWNVEHLEYPVNAVSKSEYTKVVWPLHWATIFAATDNCYCLEHNALFMIDTGYFGIQNRPLTVHNGSIMDACYSDWLNTCLSVDSSGVVEAMYLPYLMLTHKHHKSFSSRRMVMFEVKTEPLHACECEPAADPPAPCPSQRPTCPACHRPLPPPPLPPTHTTNPGSTSADEEDGRNSPTLLSSVKKVMRSMEVSSMPARPRTVTEMIQKYALVFEDRCMNNLNTQKETRIRSAKDLRADSLLPPLASQHKAEWNANLGSHLWVAVGGEAGLLRLVHFSAFGSKQEQEFVKKVFSEKGKDKQCGDTTEPL